MLTIDVEQLREIIRQELQDLQLPNSQNKVQQKPITTRELCEHLGITEPTAIKWRKRGKLPFFRIGGSVRYDLDEVLDALHRKRQYQKP
jgi:excisionase family DNA binding protein